LFPVDFATFINQYYWIFEIWVMIYLGIFGSLCLFFSIRTHRNPEKQQIPRLFKNEILIVLMFLVIIVLYPFLFDSYAPESVRAEIYFHIWDSLTVNLIVWAILLPIWKYQDKKCHFKITESEWCVQIEKIFQARAENKHTKNNFTRKKVHFIYIAIIVGLYYLGIILEQFITLPPGWDGRLVSVWLLVSVILNYLWIMMIFDLVRLLKFDSLMSKFMLDSALHSLKRDELHSFTSAHVLLLGLLPFVMVPPLPQVFLSVWLISAFSDAMASIIGMRFGKKRKESDHKSWEGYIAGFLSTYAVILFVHIMSPFPEFDWLTIHFLAFMTAMVFFFVD